MLKNIKFKVLKKKKTYHSVIQNTPNSFKITKLIKMYSKFIQSLKMHLELFFYFITVLSPNFVSEREGRAVQKCSHSNTKCPMEIINNNKCLMDHYSHASGLHYCYSLPIINLKDMNL